LAVPSLLTWLLGRMVRQRRWPDRWPLALIGAVTVAAGVAAATGRESGVHTGAFVGGIVVGAIFGAGLPLLAYYGLGRFTPGPVFVGLAIWLVSLAPLALFWLLAVYITAALVGCPPDAYECPT
jgi:hypothetical protein